MGKPKKKQAADEEEKVQEPQKRKRKQPPKQETMMEIEDTDEEIDKKKKSRLKKLKQEEESESEGYNPGKESDKSKDDDYQGLVEEDEESNPKAFQDEEFEIKAKKTTKESRKSTKLKQSTNNNKTRKTTRKQSTSSQESPQKQQAQKKTKNKILSIDDDMDENELKFADEGQIELLSADDIKWPHFMQPEHIRDMNNNSPDSPDYDNTNILVPDSFLKQQSPVFKQYWKVKQTNYDKVVFFKFGRLFMSFYHDAFIFQRLFNCHVRVWGQRPFVNIWESQYRFYIQQLVKEGYKIAIVDQLDYESNKEDDLIKRELTQVISAGKYQSTYVDEEDSEYNHRYMVALIESQSDGSYGLCAFDCTTHQCWLDEFKDDHTHINLRTILQKLQPVEVIVIKDNVQDKVIKMAKQISKPVITQLQAEFTSMPELIQKIKNMFNENQYQLPVLFTDLFKIYDTDNKLYKEEIQKQKDKGQMEEEDGLDDELDTDFCYFMMLQSLHLSIFYLEKILLQQVIFLSDYKLLDSSIQKTNHLILDSHTLENLEIFQVNYSTHVSEKGSLFDYINHTKTKFGARLLKKWLLTPLLKLSSIQERQGAIQDLIQNQDLLSTFQNKISKIPDIERACSRIFNALQTSRLNSRSHDSFSIKRVKELQSLLGQMSQVEEIMVDFEDYVQQFKSARLRSICSFKDSQGRKSARKMEEEDSQGSQYVSYIQAINKKKSNVQININGLFPQLNETIQSLLEMVEIEKDSGLIIPKQGACPKYEDGDKKVKQYRNILKQELERWQKKLNCKDIKYVDFKNFRYQLQVPERVWSEKMQVPDEFNLMSKTKDTRRFYTNLIEETVAKLREQEILNAEYVLPFLESYLKKFFQHKTIWYQAISCVAELDCYCALASCSLGMTNAVCKPKFVQEKTFNLQGMYHPCMQKAGYKMVPNNTIYVNCLLVTGPNMAGKSTLLRQACLAVILAQLGCFVPAEKFTLSIVDRIFCRIGASDKPIEGKSTFYVEMEETSVIVNECTENSLVMFDELGRGTSTYDGVSIAYGVLQFLTESKKCWTLFATHYHFLLDEFRLYNNIKFYIMNYDFDKENKVMKFTYKFEQGETAKSFGTNVARIAGIPESVIKLAEEKEKELNSETEKLGQLRNRTQIFNKTIQSLLLDDVDQLVNCLQELEIE